MRTPFRRKICVSGAYRGRRETTFILPVDDYNKMHFPRSGYHSLKSFDQTFHLEKRWKLVREMGSGAYGVVMSVRVPSPPSSCLCFPSLPLSPFFFFFFLFL